VWHAQLRTDSPEERAEEIRQRHEAEANKQASSRKAGATRRAKQKDPAKAQEVVAKEQLSAAESRRQQIQRETAEFEQRCRNRLSDAKKREEQGREPLREPQDDGQYPVQRNPTPD